jgi:hypothetical protein
MKIPRWAVGLIIAVALIVGVIKLLGFARAKAIGGTRCFIGFAHAQLPNASAAQQPRKPSDTADLSFEIYEGIWLRFVGKSVEKPSESV